MRRNAGSLARQELLSDIEKFAIEQELGELHFLVDAANAALQYDEKRYESSPKDGSELQSRDLDCNTDVKRRGESS